MPYVNEEDRVIAIYPSHGNRPETIEQWTGSEFKDEWELITELDLTDAHTVIINGTDVTAHLIEVFIDRVDVLQWEEDCGTPALVPDWDDYVEDERQDAADWARGPYHYYGIDRRSL